MGSMRTDVNTKYESIFEALDLGMDQINSQHLQSLEAGLETINELIKNPDSLPRGQRVYGGKIEPSPLPLLLHRKKLILDRIRSLQRDRQIESIRDLINDVKDERISAKLKQTLDKYEEQSRSIQQESTNVDIEIEMQFRAAERRLDIVEKRYKILQPLLERESIATIIGAFMMILITVAIIIAMFADVVVADILGNAFLVILGYFFGQSVTRGTQHREQNK